MLIDSEEKLAALLPGLRAADWVSMDTEADSLHAFPEKLCLIQIGSRAGVELVDPLAGLDLQPLLAALNGHELIMHGADYDLRLLRRHHRFVPREIFDTMLAARLVGRERFSFGDLVNHYLGVPLEKGAQKANWARRPLTPRMDAYARNDARYLKPLADRLRAELEGRERREWHREMCARLVVDCATPTEVDPDSVWRIKGSHALERRALAVLRELWTWREKAATAANRPPFFILSHETLAATAQAAAEARPWDVLLPKHFAPHRRAAVGEAVARGLALRAEALPEKHRPQFRRQSEAVRRRLNELRKWRDAAATRLGIDPTLIASRAQLGALAEDWAQHAPRLMNWQREFLKLPAHAGKGD